MNIILFCRILYADFSGIINLNHISKHKEVDKNNPEKEKKPFAKQSHQEGSYVNSLFEEEQVDKKLSAD